MKIEILSIPVADQERAIGFYEKIGFKKIYDYMFGENMRWVELTLGRETNIVLVNWFPEMPAGSVHGLILQVNNIFEKHKDLSEKGIVIDPIFDTPWGKFANFKDLDGNGWSLREII